MVNGRLAAFFLVVLALVIAGIMVETYWDCRLKRRLMNECIPGSGPPVSGVGTTNPTLR